MPGPVVHPKITFFENHECRIYLCHCCLVLLPVQIVTARLVERYTQNHQTHRLKACLSIFVYREHLAQRLRAQRTKGAL
jgi:hypothetical protein